MKAAAFACFTLGALLIVAAFAFAVAGIWLNDMRWGGTTFVTFIGAMAAGGGGAAFLDFARRN